MSQLTVLIPAGNAQEHLAACIESVRGLGDEIMVVVDAASTDGTLAIARANADTVLVHEYVNSAAQKNWAIPQASHPWVLVVDTDERVTPELREEIAGIVAADGPMEGYRIHRINHFAGKRIVGCGWQRDDVLRLFRRDRGRYAGKHVHADVESIDDTPLRVGMLKARFLHYTFSGLDHFVAKQKRYAAWTAEDRFQRTGRINLVHLAGRPTWRFIRMYMINGGWRDGLHGFVICWTAAYHVFLAYAYIWERQERQRGDAP